MLTRTAMNKLRNIGFNQADFLAISNILSGACNPSEVNDALDITEIDEERLVTGSAKNGYSRTVRRSAPQRRLPLKSTSTVHRT